MSDTLLAEKPLTIDTTPGGFRHYFSKEDLDLNLLEGKTIVAICGFIKVDLAKPDSSLPVCDLCDWLWKNVSYN